MMMSSPQAPQMNYQYHPTQSPLQQRMPPNHAQSVAQMQQQQHRQRMKFDANTSAGLAQLADFASEPLVLNISPGATSSMYNTSLSDFDSIHMGHLGQSPMDHKNLKRSREELNLKEKKRMSKLNDRIQHFKDILDGAGIASKKNKQSILDNTAYYIKMLQSDLSGFKQRAERAEEIAQRPSKVRKMVETCSVAMVTGKATGEMMYCSKEFEKLAGPENIPELQTSTPTFLSKMGSKFQETLQALCTVKSTQKRIFWDTFGEKRCRYSLSLIFNEGAVESYQCILIPKSELVEE